MYAPHVLPAARDYDALYRSFRWQVPARYNIGVDVCDRWAARDPRRIAIFDVRADGDVGEVGYGWLRETSNRLANVLAARGIARGDRVAILLPQAPAVAAAHVAIYKLGGIALPLAMLFGPEAISYRLRDSGARALITNAQGLAKLADIADCGARPGAVDRWPGRRRRRFVRGARACVAGVRAGRYGGRRAGADGLHVGHDRTAQGRAPCAPRAARPPAGHRAPARVSAAAGRPVLDAGGLGLGRRPAQRAAAGPALRRAGGRRAPREVRSRGGVRPDGEARGAQCVHPADRVAHAALGTASAGTPRHPPALGRLRRRGARRRDLRVGKIGARPHHQRVLRPDRMQSRGRFLRGDRRVAARRDRQAGAGPHGRGDPPGRLACARRASSARSRSGVRTR